MALQGTRRQLGDVTIVDFSGKITLGEGSAMLRNTVRDLINAGNKKILLSLYDVDYIDSSGIGELVSAYTTVKNASGELKLLHLTKRVHDILQNHPPVHCLRRAVRRRRRHQKLQGVTRNRTPIWERGEFAYAKCRKAPRTFSVMRCRLASV